jgi:hypothetical protein
LAPVRLAEEIDTVLPPAASADENATTTDVNDTSSEPTFVTNVNEFVATVADADPLYSLSDAVNEPPIVNDFCEIVAVVVGAPVNDNE